MRQKVFLSYSRADRDWVDFLYRGLVDLVGHGTDILWDQQIPTAKAWHAFLEREVTDADRMVLVATPEAIASPHVQQERALFVQRANPQRLCTIRRYDWALPVHLRTQQLVDCFDDAGSARALHQLAAWIRDVALTSVPTPAIVAVPGPPPRLAPPLFAELLQLLLDGLGRATPRDLGALTSALELPDRTWHEPFEHAIEKANAAIRRFEEQAGTADPIPRTQHLLDCLERSFFDASLTARLQQLRHRLDAAARAHLPAPTSAPTPATAPATAAATTAPSGFARHLQDYRAAMQESCGRIEFAGFESAVQVPIRMHQLWVDLCVVPTRTGRDLSYANAKEAADALGPPDGDRSLDLEGALQRAAQQQQHGLVVLGDPGSGKTTLLRRTAYEALQKPRAYGLDPEVLPLLLPLRRLQPGDLDHGIDRLLQRELPKHCGLPDTFAADLWRRGNLLVLVDGLDEVPGPQRADAVGWISAALRQRADCRFVVTCRYAGYTVPFDEHFLQLHLQRFSYDATKQFITRWYRAVETTLQPDSGPTTAAEAAADLIERLLGKKIASNRLLEMATNPLLLTNICLVHRSRSRYLPEARHRLYEECLNTLLEHWPLLRKQLHVRSDLGKRALQPVAHHLHEQRKAILPGKDLEAPLREGLASAEIRTEPAEFLRQVRDHSGLLTGWSGDHFGFLHLGFQEYLTAREIGRRAIAKLVAGDASHGELRQLAERLGDSWWQEVILLFVASEPELVGKFYEQLVKVPQFGKDHTFLLDCLREAARKDPAPFIAFLRQATVPHGAPTTAALLAVRTLAPGLADQLVRDLPWLAAGAAPSVPAGVLQMPSKQIADVTFLQIPTGSFLMGSPPSESERHGDEGPQHSVKFARPFWMARTAITNKQYRRFVEATQRAVPAVWSRGAFNGDEQPVVDVSWEDARDYCRWLGEHIRLPSEAEWEYACRAGTTTPFSFGENVTPAQVNYNGNHPYASGKQGEYRERTVEVGSLPANAWGLHEMHGNVWEWCQDRWHDNYKAAPSDGSAWEQGGSGDRVLRGGSWFDDARACRSACRSGRHPGYRGGHVGFRPASSSL